MTQYKTIAGPIGLEAKTGEDYEAAVKKYAAIIDAEAVGGWELHLIQQIAASRWFYWTVMLGAALGAFVGAYVGSELFYDEVASGFFLGLFVGAVLGCLGVRKVTEFFNMLVFVKHK